MTTSSTTTRQDKRQTGLKYLTVTVAREEEGEKLLGLRAMAWFTMCWYLEYFSIQRMYPQSDHAFTSPATHGGGSPWSCKCKKKRKRGTRGVSRSLLVLA